MPMLIGSPVHCRTVCFRSLAECSEVFRYAHEIEKTFVDRVFLHRRDQFPEGLHHPVAHVGIELEVAADDRDAVPLDEVFRLERRLRHLDAERLRLVAARHDAAVVRRQDDGGTAFEGWPEDSLSQETKKLLQSASP